MLGEKNALTQVLNFKNPNFKNPKDPFISRVLVILSMNLDSKLCFKVNSSCRDLLLI
jgi:hypothetical protein